MVCFIFTLIKPRMRLYIFTSVNRTIIFFAGISGILFYNFSSVPAQIPIEERLKSICYHCYPYHYHESCKYAVTRMGESMNVNIIHEHAISAVKECCYYDKVLCSYEKIKDLYEKSVKRGPRDDESGASKLEIGYLMAVMGIIIWANCFSV